MQEPDPYNIPAFQRKRSLSARAKKIGINSSFSKKKGNTTKKATKTKTFSNPFEMEDLPGISSLPSEESFESNKKAPNTREFKKCGICEGYFSQIDVAIIKLTSPLRMEDKIIFEIENGLFEQKINSMQINRKDISLGRTGDEIGIKVKKQPQVGGTVYKTID